MKKILTFMILLIISLFFIIPSIDAKPKGYYITGGTCKQYPNIPHPPGDKNDDSILGFCVQPGTTYTSSHEYEACDLGLSCYDAAVAYYGAMVNVEDFWQSQSILNGRKYYSDDNCNSIISTTNAHDYATSYCTTPNFGNTTLNLKVGDEVTYTDLNNVISNYSFNSESSALSVTKTTNGIKITALSAVSNAKISFYKGETSSIIGHCSDDSQNYITVAAAPYVLSEIFVTISENEIITTPKYGILKVVKINQDNEPLEGVKFKIGTNLNGTEGTDWNMYTTNSSGIISINNIPVNSSYYYQEAETLEGYVLDSTMNYVYINDEAVFTRTVTNSLENRGLIKLIKINQYNERLSGVKFKIGTNLNGAEGTDWDTYTTNSEGEIVISDLPLDTTLYAQEIQTIEGHTFNSDDTYRLTVNEEQTIEVITITNTKEVEKRLKIIKRTTETNELLPNVKINVYKSDGTLYYEGTTNNEGIIEIEIEEGEYYLEEIEAPIGHVKLNEKYEFVVSENNPNITIELFNDLKNQKTGQVKIIIPFLTFSILAIGTYLVLKTKQKII